MKILKSSTALALVLGFGVAMAGLPAYAAGEQTDVTAGTAAETGTTTGTEAAAGAEAQTGMEGDDEFVTSEQARSDAERQFDELGRGEEYLTQEHMGTAFPEAEGEDLFAQIDEDGDGQISREEWINWREGGFAEATQGTEGRMSAQEYETWQRSPGVGLEGDEAGAEGETTSQ